VSPPPPALRSVAFRLERERAWRALESLVSQVEKHGLRALSAAELHRLHTLYRATLSSLSVARAISLDRNVTAYLEVLATRAYLAIYGAKRRPIAAIRAFFTARFPALVRRFAPHVALSAGFVAAGAAAGFALTLADPERYYSFVDPGLAGGRDPGATTESLRATLFDGPQQSEGELGLFAAFLFTHNTGVGILAFALGGVAGIPVAYLNFRTGLMLGGFAALFHSRGLGLEFWSWILPHGIAEILAFVLCGAGGLIVAQGLIAPGRRTRLASLARHGRAAGQLVVGTIALFLYAGLVEGIFRQSVQDLFVRYAVALCAGGALLAYFLWAGRGTDLKDLLDDGDDGDDGAGDGAGDAAEAPA